MYLIKTICIPIRTFNSNYIFKLWTTYICRQNSSLVKIRLWMYIGTYYKRLVIRISPWYSVHGCLFNIGGAVLSCLPAMKSSPAGPSTLHAWMTGSVVRINDARLQYRLPKCRLPKCWLPNCWLPKCHLPKCRLPKCNIHDSPPTS
jgi:hypothetical protein